MRLTIADIKTGYPAIADCLPEMLRNLRDGKYFIFGYDDNPHGGGIRIAEETMKTYPQIDLSIFKIQTRRVGYMNEPFETRNILFYKVIKYFCENAKDNSEAMSEIDRMYKISSAKEQAENNYVFSPEYTNSFDIVDRASMEKALLRFFRIAQPLITPTLSVFDSLDNFYKKEKNICFYGNVLEKIVHSVASPDGGLIPEEFGNLRYMYVGQSGVFKDGDKLKEAKELLRGGAHMNYIYSKTGWFTNRFDGKWRTIISDEGAKFTEKTKLFIANSTGLCSFYNTDPNAMNEFLISSNPNMKEYLPKHKTTLSDILDHEKLYDVYPELKFTKIFFGVSNHDADYKFFLNPTDNYIVIYGNPATNNLKRVLLHETQHWVQNREGFGSGGNTELAAMVSALGGKNLRAYLNMLIKAVDYFTKSGRCTYEVTQKLCSKIEGDPALDINTKSGFKMIRIIGEKEFESNGKTIVNSILNLYIASLSLPSLANEKKNASIVSALDNYYGEEFANIAIKVNEFVEQGKRQGVELSRLGYSPSDYPLIYFKLYESISGELEARDTQNTPYEEDVFKKYPTVFLPLTVEAYDPSKIEVINFNERIKGTYRSACELTSDKKYIIHLSAGNKTEPIFHELGHILYDLFTEKKTEKEKDAQRYTNPNQEEDFVAGFLKYLSVNVADNKIKQELSLIKASITDEQAKFFKVIFKS